MVVELVLSQDVEGPELSTVFTQVIGSLPTMSMVTMVSHIAMVGSHAIERP